jgi:hypothetical protein
MQKNKYLDDLGLKITDYGTNFISDDDERSEDWKKQREEYGFDSRECWCLNVKLIEWLYSHLMMYLEDASTVVDLSYYKFEHNDKTYTQEEAIKYIIEKLKRYLVEIDEASWTDKEVELIDEVHDAFDMLNKILFALWW